MTTYAHEDLKRILDIHRKWYYGAAGGVRADLTRADLTRANLTGTNLTRADLTGANLAGANLADANLADANLTGADLTGADLTRANLAGANLTGANLTGANLADANLTRAVLSDGVRWGEYLSDLVPALLVAGGKTLEEVATPAHWNCHSWNGDTVGCPMAVAFSARSLSDIPALHRWQAGRFIQLFDARLIPLPVAGASGAQENT